MKALAWIVAIFAVAVGLTLLARYNTGYVQLVTPPWRVEFSLNLPLLGLALAFAVSYAAVRAVSATVGLPRRVRECRLARRREKARATLLEALQEYFAGRYAKAEQAASASIRLGEHTRLSAVLAARAAHELRGYDRRDAYLLQAAGTNPEEDLPRIVTETELLLEQRQ